MNAQYGTFLILVAACLICACGESNEDSSELADTGVADSSVSPDQGSTSGTNGTSEVLCGLQEEGEQRLVYDHSMRGNSTPIDEMLPFNYAWTCDVESRTLTGNGIPNHAVTNGQFATQLSAQNVSITLALEPEVTDQITEVKEPGYALNSIKFDPATAGTCPDDATSDRDCNYAMGSDMWQMVATSGDVSPWKFSFGVDDNNAHTQPNGQYHYHGNPIGLVEKLNPNNETSMTLVGWATDGFPIYSIYGHSDPQDTGSNVVKMQSSYRTIGTLPNNRPTVEDFPLGHFTSDWEYVADSGDLDECNGRFAATPDFPQGIYHYYITETYPFVQRCVKGTSAAGMGRPGRP